MQNHIMDLFSSDFTLGRNGDANDIFLNLNDVLYSDVDLSVTSFSCLTHDEETSPPLDTRMTLKSPWNDSDSGVSENVSEINIASPENNLDLETFSDHNINTRSNRFIIRSKSEINLFGFENEKPCWNIDFDTANEPKDCQNSFNENNYLAKQQEISRSNHFELVNTDMNKSPQAAVTVLTLSQNDHSKLANSVNTIRSTNSTSNCKSRFTSISSGASSASDLESERTDTEFKKSPEKENKSLNLFYKNKEYNLSSNEVDCDRSRNKNAIQAKLNREKKKAYVKGLELEVEALKKDNAELNSENSHYKLANEELEKEVEYLKSVLVNSSALSSILKNIGNTCAVNLSSSIMNRKRKLEHTACETTPSGSGLSNKRMSAGICLHIKVVPPQSHLYFICSVGKEVEEGRLSLDTE
ncbi:CREB/ATF bZIP transcription factor [Biomphalaria glabrata]|nr:CREB/ATF bZIP transcription factor [Biomphalaria glabrata]